MLGRPRRMKSISSRTLAQKPVGGSAQVGLEAATNQTDQVKRLKGPDACADVGGSSRILWQSFDCPTYKLNSTKPGHINCAK